jgi:hypothetical protein
MKEEECDDHQIDNQLLTTLLDEVGEMQHSLRTGLFSEKISFPLL